LLEGCISLSKGLATQGHHVWDGVEVNGLVFMCNSAADVPHFEKDLIGQLTLNREVEGVNDVRPKMRIQGFAGGC